MKYVFIILLFFMTDSTAFSQDCKCPTKLAGSSVLATNIQIIGIEKIKWNYAEDIRLYVQDENGLESEEQEIVCVSKEIYTSFIAENANVFLQDGTGETFLMNADVSRFQEAIQSDKKHVFELHFNDQGSISSFSEVSYNYPTYK